MGTSEGLRKAALLGGLIAVLFAIGAAVHLVQRLVGAEVPETPPAAPVTAPSEPTRPELRRTGDRTVTISFGGGVRSTITFDGTNDEVEAQITCLTERFEEVFREHSPEVRTSSPGLAGWRARLARQRRFQEEMSRATTVCFLEANPGGVADAAGSFAEEIDATGALPLPASTPESGSGP